MENIPIGLKIDGYRVIITDTYIKVEDKVVDITGNSLVVELDSFKFYLYKRDNFINVRIVHNDEFTLVRIFRSKL